jgi:hypothetical protein
MRSVYTCNRITCTNYVEDDTITAAPLIHHPDPLIFGPDVNVKYELEAECLRIADCLINRSCLGPSTPARGGAGLCGLTCRAIFRLDPQKDVLWDAYSAKEMVQFHR